MRMLYETESKIKPLIEGVLEDVQTLIRQEFTLVKALIKGEARRDLAKGKEVGVSVGLGIILACITLFFFAFMVVHLIQWGFPDLPLWGCYGIVSLLTAIGSATFFLNAGKSFKEMFGPEPSYKELHKNIEQEKYNA